jgi:hypothetical protein
VEKIEDVGEDGRESGKLKERVKVELDGGVEDFVGRDEEVG